MTERKDEASVQNPFVVLAGIEQFGLAPDGADLRDLRTILTALQERVRELEGEIAKAEEDEQHWFEEATYEVGGAPRLWKDRAESAEAERDRLREEVEILRKGQPNPRRCASCDGRGGHQRSFGWVPCDACNGRGY